MKTTKAELFCTNQVINFVLSIFITSVILLTLILGTIYHGWWREYKRASNTSDRDLLKYALNNKF